MISAKKISFVIGLLLLTWVSWRTYSYFFDTSIPTFEVQGLEDGAYFNGNISCKVIGHDDYKVDKISITLDNKPLANNFKIGRKNFEHTFEIPTKTLSNDQHTLKINIVDSSKRKNSCQGSISFYVDNNPLQTAYVNPINEHKIFQGRTLHIQFQANKKIKSANTHLISKQYKFYPEVDGSGIYECFIPIDCEENPNEYPYTIEIEDFVGNKSTLDGKVQILPYPFKKHTLAISNEKIQEEKEIGKPDAELNLLLMEATAKSPDKKLWNGVFYVPTEMSRISCDYGTIRMSQHKGCYMHKALDLVGLPKSVVWAPQDGIVVVKDRFFSSGNTIAIDHGCGIISLLFHLDKFSDINVGDKIKRGNPVGTIGKTGHATGYHLHWEMRINNIATDPMQWTKINF